MLLGAVLVIVVGYTWFVIALLAPPIPGRKSFLERISDYVRGKRNNESS